MDVKSPQRVCRVRRKLAWVIIDMATKQSSKHLLWICFCFLKTYGLWEGHFCCFLMSASHSGPEMENLPILNLQ